MSAFTPAGSPSAAHSTSSLLNHLTLPTALAAHPRCYNRVVSDSTINRQNALHSTGPRTDEGKRRSSLNALRHGLTAQLVLLPTEDPEAYRLHSQCFADDNHPQGPIETGLVQLLADIAWRLNR